MDLPLHPGPPMLRNLLLASALLISAHAPLDAAPLPSATVTLTITGTCPGTMDFTVRGATPSGLVVLVYGGAGSTTRHSNPCNGMTIPLSPVRLGGVLPASVSGIAFVSTGIPAGACGKSVAAIDLSTCTSSAPVVL